jgi:adenylylsulfate kinase
MNSSNVIYHQATVTRKRRNKLNEHRSVVLWFTGLSGPGKSTLAYTLEEKLFQKGRRTFV